MEPKAVALVLPEAGGDKPPFEPASGGVEKHTKRKQEVPMGCPQTSQIIEDARRTPGAVEEVMGATWKRVSMPVVHPWQVDRSDITFHNTTADRVQIGVTVHNQSPKWSPPTTMVLQSAVLGAFVPWRPLTSVDVPEIEPWGQAQVTTEACHVRSSAIGDIEHLTAQLVLDALEQSELRDRIRRIEQQALARMPDRNRAPWQPEAMMRAVPILPEDLLALIGRPTFHWAGNLNVFIGARAVECHCAQALRVYPGRMNLAVFEVGSGNDAYAFHVTGAEPDWNVALHSTGCGNILAVFDRRRQIVPNQWIAGREVRLVRFTVCPPEGCGQGEVAVHVTQQSTGAEAVVEFSMDPRAAGAGCFVL